MKESILPSDNNIKIHADNSIVKKWFTRKPTVINFLLIFLGLKWKMLILAIFLTLLGVLLYQLYAPLTALRYWQCSRGSISDSTSSFTFKTSNYQVNNFQSSIARMI